MTSSSEWQTQNQQHISAALRWLRSRLAWHILQECSARGQSPPEFLSRLDTGNAADLEAALAKAELLHPPPAMILLGQKFGLSRFEQDIVLLCAAMELDKHAASLCAQLYPYQSYPTFALALSIFEAPAWDALSSQRPLRYWQLIEINQPNAQPLVTSALRLDERIVNYLKGLNPLDERLMPFLVPFDARLARVGLPASQKAAVSAITQGLEQKYQQGSLPIIQLLGADYLSKQLVAWFAAKELGLHLYCLPVELLPTQAAELETLTRLWRRESLLLPLALYLDAQEINSAPAAEGQVSPLQRFLMRYQGLCFLAIREARPYSGRSRFVLEVAKPTLVEQKAAWIEVLGESARDTVDRLVGQFNLNLPEIQELAEMALNETAEEGRDPHSRLWYHCQVNTRPQLDSLAQRLNVKASWDDIVLPEKEMALLRQLIDQVRYRAQVYESWGFNRKMNRGLGINALFAGDSGTGKTMAAEVIANELNLDLFRIDLSKVVNKYIGETEKNLCRLFDAAEDGGAILFFDEADALCGKRSEIKDSHDRYANIEIDYLLQRMEAYRGLAILATNLKSAIDKAFLRRLRFLIDFPFPGVAERRVIWQRAFPPETPINGLDWAYLARFNLTGGNVHNIALNASFLAAKAGSAVTMPLVLESIRTEFDKIERPINEAEFGWTSPVGIQP